MTEQQNQVNRSIDFNAETDTLTFVHPITYLGMAFTEPDGTLKMDLIDRIIEGPHAYMPTEGLLLLATLTFYYVTHHQTKIPTSLKVTPMMILMS